MWDVSTSSNGKQIRNISGGWSQRVVKILFFYFLFLNIEHFRHALTTSTSTSPSHRVLETTRNSEQRRLDRGASLNVGYNTEIIIVTVIHLQKVVVFACGETRYGDAFIMTTPTVQTKWRPVFFISFFIFWLRAVGGIWFLTRLKMINTILKPPRETRRFWVCL